MARAEDMTDFDALDASEDAREFKSDELRAIDEQIAHRRELLKQLFTVFGTGLTNIEKLDVLHELTRPDDRSDPREAAKRLAALAEPWMIKGIAAGPGRFYLLASDLYTDLAQRVGGIMTGAIRDEPH